MDSDAPPKPVYCMFTYYQDGDLMETVCYMDGTDETRVVRESGNATS